MDIAMVVEVARLLYGQDWQRPLARGLGPLHPDGPRESIDDRLVRRWAAEERPVPDWVYEALWELLRERADRYDRAALACRRRADALRLDLDLAADAEPDPDEDLAPRM